MKQPWYFEVNEYGTIGEADDTGPAVNSDVYEDIDVSGLQTPEDIVAEVDQYDELRERFQARCAEEVEEIEARLEDSKLSSARRKKLEERRDQMQDPDDGWQAWVESGGKRGVAGFRTLIQEWLDEDVDWSQSDSWPSGWAGQDRAMSFFQDMDGKMLDALGVVIVEGDNPGSTYFAAELRGKLEDANAVAEREGLPFRFRVGWGSVSISTQIMETPSTLEFLGPYSWHGAPDAPSVFTAPIASQPGIYLWTIALPDGYATYYVGETSRSFARRMEEHFREHAACMYTLYEPEQFASGVKVKLWPGRLGQEKRSIAECVAQSVVFAPQIAATTQLFRFFLAPTTCDERTRQRAESCIADCLYNTPGMIGDFQNKGIRYCRRQETEKPLQFSIRSSSRLMGIPAEILG